MGSDRSLLLVRHMSPVASISTRVPHRGGPQARKLRSSGRATYCTEVRIVDPEGQEVPRGTVGEIVVGGPNVMQG